MFAYDFVIAQLGQIFNAYCNARKLRGSGCILSQHFPQEISKSSSDDVIRYFQWVRKAQDVLIVWQGKFLHNEVNFDDVLTYASHHVSIDRVGRALCAHTVVMDSQDVQDVKNLFITSFDQLNIYLLKYIPGHPEARWCTLPALLAHYGASLPHHLQDTISKHILFPGERKPLVGQLLHNNFPVTSTGQFQPGHEISLKLTKAITLRKLLELLHDIMALLQGLLDHLDMFVFFHLQQSEIFKKHLLKHLEAATKEAVATLERSTMASTSFSFLPSVRPSLSYRLKEPQKQPQQQQQESGVTLEMLEQGLESVRNLLYRLAEGTATYADIVAEGALKLETLNIEREFDIFSQYARYTGLAHIEGLAGVQSMLELFQFTHHIDKIYRVCEQYQLKECLADPDLHRLMDIVKELSSEDTRANLTPMDALKKVSKN